MISPANKTRRLTHPCLRPLETPDIYWVLALALLARFAVCLLAWRHPEALETEWSARYVELAGSLAERGTYCELKTKGVVSSADLPPAYPFFLALQWVLIRQSAHVQMMTQALLAMLTCGLIYAVAHGLLRRPTALGVGLLCVADPTMTFHSLLVSHEGLYLFFLALAAWALVQAFKHDYLWAWALGGAALALAALTWPDAFWTWAPVMLCIAAWRRHRPVGYIVRASCFLAVFAVIVGLWVGRNCLVAGQAVFANDAGRRWIENRAAAVAMGTRGLSRKEAIDALYDEIGQRLEGSDFASPGFSRSCRSHALFLLGSHPVILVKLWGGGVYRSLTDCEPQRVEKIVRIRFFKARDFPLVVNLYVVLATGFQCLLLALIVAGAIHHRTWRSGFGWWGPVLYVIYFLPFMADLDAGAWLRLPVAPALFILAGAEVERYWPWIMRRFKYSPGRFGTVVHDGPVIGKSDRGGTAL